MLSVLSSVFHCCQVLCTQMLQLVSWHCSCGSVALAVCSHSWRSHLIMLHYSWGPWTPLGKNHSPTFPPSLILQHRVLTLLVTHTKDKPGSSGEMKTPIWVMRMVSPGRYTVPSNIKYRPELGTARGNYYTQANPSSNQCTIIPWFWASVLMICPQLTTITTTNTELALSSFMANFAVVLDCSSNSNLPFKYVTAT